MPKPTAKELEDALLALMKAVDNFEGSGHVFGCCLFDVDLWCNHQSCPGHKEPCTCGWKAVAAALDNATALLFSAVGSRKKKT